MSTPENGTTQTTQFTESNATITELLEMTHELADLSALGALAGWDQNTALPEGAGEVRGAQLATLEGVMHDRETAPHLGALLKQIEPEVQGDGFTDADRGLVRQMSRSYTHATKLPKGLVQELARVEAASYEAWHRARANNDFASFAPWLAKTITLQREVADRYGYRGTRYDALLDLYEPGMTTAQLDPLFAQVREISVNLLRRIQASGKTIDDTCLTGDFAPEPQMALCEQVLRHIGYDFSRGAIARSPHPFTTDFGSPYDVRLTVNPNPRFLQAAVMAAIHEGGHALYEQGTSPSLTRTPVGGGASLGAHESQSRLWENAIGRSEPFWQGFYPAVREAFPQHFAQVDVTTFTRALNRVAPSLIRIEADEVTYNLHILIRYELERAMVEGDVAVESLPAMWNAKYEEYLGVTPPNDTQGILQDVHWTSGFGYFPTYTLGNLYAAQIFARLHTVFPDFDERLATGDTAFIRAWLREHMYQFGAIYEPATLVAKVTGEQPDPSYFANYLNAKFEQVYGLA